MKEEKFKKFWVMSINGWICAAGYNGKELKNNYPGPSFRKFHFIRNEEDLRRFNKREGFADNKELVDKLLKPTKP